MIGFGSVLLVDDEETFRESTCRLLRRQGLDCQGAGDAEEGITALQRGCFDVLVTDIRMPANPDLRLVQAAREIDRQLPVILVTGYPSMDTAIRSLALSVEAYLVKPLDFEELLEHIKTAIRHSWRRQKLTSVRDRLRTCLAELDALLASAPPAQPGGNGVGRLSPGTLRTLAACLSDLLSLAAQSQEDWATQNLCELLDCPQQPLHRQAIAHTIDVLKQTKGTFKSKTLADLRTQLEMLLQHGIPDGKLPQG